MMAYVSTHSYDEETIETAVLIFERYLGYSLIETEYTDRLKVGRYGFELKHTPLVRIISVKARTNDWGSNWNASEAFGTSVWYEIPLEHVVVHPYKNMTLIYVPPSIFGTAYTEIEVRYTAGLVEVPEDVQDAILQIADLVAKNEVDTWNCRLPVHILDVIEKYRKEVD